MEDNNTIEYLGFPNVSLILAQNVSVVRLGFPFLDQVNYTSFITVLVAKQGIIFLTVNNDGNVDLVDILDPTPFG
jgi:hypothetical protein